MMISELKDAADFSKIQRVLVIKLRHLGDVLITSPVFTVLHNHYPHIEVDALVYKDTRDMLSLHPHLSQLHVIDRQWKKLGVRKQMAAEWGLIQQLKERQYDLIIHLTEHWRGMMLGRMLKPRYAVTGIYEKRNSKLWRNTFTHEYPIVSRRHMVEVQLDALRRIGLQPKRDERELGIWTSPETDQKVLDLLKQHQLDPGGYIHIHPTSRWMFKSWDPQKFREVIQRLQAGGHKIVVTSAPDPAELAMVDEILQGLPNQPINFAGKLSLKELVVIIRHARCFMGVDSVPMHIAAATKTPCITLFGPSGETEWGPWSRNNTILTSPVTCRPCGKDGCGGGKLSECVWDITADRVVTAVEHWARQ